MVARRGHGPCRPAVCAGCSAAASASSRPASRKGRAMAVFEVLKPAPQRAVDVFDDHLQALAVGASRLGPNRVLELLQALLPRPLHASLEVIAQKVKASRLVASTIRVLVGCSVRPACSRPLPHPLQGSLALPPGFGTGSRSRPRTAPSRSPAAAIRWSSGSR